MYTIKLASGETQGKFKTEQEAYDHIVAYWPSWMMNEPFTVVKVES